MNPIISVLKEQNKKLNIVITGGGSAVISRFLEVGGASSVVVDAQVPYSKEALDNYLGKSPDKYCSADTATMMAATAYYKALNLGVNPNNAIGLGVTCSLTRNGGAPEVREDGTVRPHNAFISFHSRNQTEVIKVDLFDYSRTRVMEEEAVVSAILSGLKFSLRVELDILPFQDLEHVEYSHHSYESLFPYAMLPRLELRNEPYALKIGSKLNSKLIYPGSFNPFHKGHLKICEFLYEKYGEPVGLEISLLNRDKPPVDFYSLDKRISSIPQNLPCIGPIYVTNTPFFDDKVKVFRDCKFVVGADTWNRVLEDLVELIEKPEHKFIVMPRSGVTIEDWSAISSVDPNCFSIEEEFVSEPISSSEIRRNKES